MVQENWSTDELNYPRPQLRRDRWMNLNGSWKFQYDDHRTIRHPSEIKEWALKIEVPFAPESPASGISDTGFHDVCWYSRQVRMEKPRDGKRIHLHFEAVDYFAKVWVNGNFVGSHEGGNTPFLFDITNVLNEDGDQEIAVRAEDDAQDLAKPRGKQDWQREPHSIWYPRTTGIWQSVWIEQVERTHIGKLRWEPHLERWEISCEVFLAGERDPSVGASVSGDGPNAKSKASALASAKESNFVLEVKMQAHGRVLVLDRYQVSNAEVHRRIALSDPGIDDFRNELLWSPERPTLIEAEITLFRQVGGRDVETLDHVKSYTALRSVGTSRDRFTLNGRPYFLRMVLDQGYWPETFLTPKDSEACRRDIELMKAAGFNGARKHQKIESPWYLYWADRLGFVVWEEMPSAYRFTSKSVERITREWMEAIDRDYNHPCICVRVPFNESWGVPDLAQREPHQNAVRALYHLTKTLDPYRLVIANDGWEALATDLIGIHDYEGDPKRMFERYGGSVNVAEMLEQKRPAGRVLTIETHPHEGQPILLTEFGGVAIAGPKFGEADHTWGYSTTQNTNDLEIKYRALLLAVNMSEVFSGFCYTQFTDTFQEANGLFYANREPKFPLHKMNDATHGRA